MWVGEGPYDTKMACLIHHGPSKLNTVRVLGQGPNKIAKHGTFWWTMDSGPKNGLCLAVFSKHGPEDQGRPNAARFGAMVHGPLISFEPGFYLFLLYHDRFSFVIDQCYSTYFE